MKQGLAFAAVVLASCSSLPDPSELESSADVTFSKFVSDVPVEHMASLEDDLFRGAQPNRAGLAALRAKGVKTIVNFRTMHSERRDAEALGFKVVEIPLEAGLFGSTAPTADEIAKFLDVVTDPANRPVYFHCAHGKDRTGTMAAIYRMEVQGWTARDAVAEMHALGYHTIYEDLIDCVRGYRPTGNYARAKAPAAVPSDVADAAPATPAATAAGTAVAGAAN
ncbi:MAG TPA: tyrosine-protein phosphatase [Planctomycetota bacterium]|nr:tyrosine-protein phosphatase [Planctomycetota bacterium]